MFPPGGGAPFFLGFLVEKGFVEEIICRRHVVMKTAWEVTKPLIPGMRTGFAAEDYYFFFEKLFNRLSKTETAL